MKRIIRVRFQNYKIEFEREGGLGMKILTVLVPVYNVEKYIRRCLDSLLLSEVLDDIEVLIVNDGSKDSYICGQREWWTWLYN